MAQRLLLAAFCVLVVVCATSVEGACRSRCLKRCSDQRDNAKIKMSHMACVRACISMARRCKSCSGPNKCLKCLSGYKLSSTTSRCYPCTIGCQCSPSNPCIACLPNYIATAQGCVACPTGCTCDANAKCTSCNPGYVAGARTTDPPCVACSANCQACGSIGAGKCNDCNPGFLLVNYLCEACAPHCATCATAGGCSNCMAGYTLVSGACEKCPDNCQSCDYAGKSYCDTCMSGYGLSPDHKSCVACASNCNSCYAKGYGKCDPSTCGSYAGLAYSGTTKTCGGSPCVKGSEATADGTCDVCYTSAAECDICAATNIQIGTSCYDGCPDSTAGGTGANCLFCTSLAGCVKCDDSYTGDDCTGTLDTSCTPASIPGCKHCASSTACGDCKKGYTFNSADNTCTKCKDTQCEVCEDSFDVCQKCSTDYNVIGSVCSKCDPRCATATCATAGRCDTYCVDGYAVVVDPDVEGYQTCQPCAPGCKSCVINGPAKCDDQQCAMGSLTADFKCA